MKAGWVLPLGWAALLVVLPTAPAVAERAVVQGANVLNIRRGPGTDHAPMATVQAGQEVNVLRMEGVWAVVEMPGGKEGYVRKEYLTISQPPSAPSEGSGVGSAPPEAAPPAVPEALDLRALREENSRLTAEVALLRERASAALPPAPGAVVPAVAEPASLREDLQRLLQMTEELRVMIAAQSDHRGAVPHAAPAEAWLLSNGWVLAVSALLGGVVGAAYGRAQERRRRTRIRF